MKRLFGTIASIALALLLSTPAPASDIEMTRAEIQKTRQKMVAAGLGLTEEEALGFWPAYRDYRVEMARLGDRLVRTIEEFVASEATLTDEQANRLLDELLDIRAGEVSVRKKHVKQFRKILPPTKVARFFQIENKLDAVIHYELAARIPLVR